MSQCQLATCTHLLATENWHNTLRQPAATIPLYPLPCLLCMVGRSDVMSGPKIDHACLVLDAMQQPTATHAHRLATWKHTCCIGIYEARDLCNQRLSDVCAIFRELHSRECLERCKLTTPEG